MKICAVIVTFNRLKLLKEAISGVVNQTRALDKIIVIDNDSTDGTREWLKTIENNFIQIIFQENLGGAGGFHTGVKLAYEQGYDWIWMMDDDVEPKNNCLEELLKFKNVSQCLHPRKIYKDGIDFYWEGFYNYILGWQNTVDNLSFKNGKNICFVNSGNFEGMLISKEIIKKIGYPNTDFFIAGDDTDYGFKASFHTNVSYLKDAIIIRKKNSNEEVESIFYKYYYLRNRHLLKENLTYLDRENYSKMFNFETFHIFMIFVKSEILNKNSMRIKISNIKILIRAYRDNFLKKVGKTF